NRMFSYELRDGKKELTGITDTRMTAQGEQSRTWTRHENPDGSLSNWFLCTDGKVETRFDVKVNKEGEYEYRNFVGEKFLSRGERKPEGTIDSQNIQEARAEFTRSFPEGFSEQRKQRLEQFMDHFETRMSNRAFARKLAGTDEDKVDSQTQKAIAQTYGHLAELVSR